jgi:hypothetical protein
MSASTPKFWISTAYKISYLAARHVDDKVLDRKDNYGGWFLDATGLCMQIRKSLLPASHLICRERLSNNSLTGQSGENYASDLLYRLSHSLEVGHVAISKGLAIPGIAPF